MLALDNVQGYWAGIFILRIAVGVVMIAHGYNHIWGGGKIEGTAGWFASLGMKPGILHAWLASITELVCGGMLILGFLQPLAAAGRDRRDDGRAHHQPPEERLLHLPAG